MIFIISAWVLPPAYIPSEVYIITQHLFIWGKVECLYMMRPHLSIDQWIIHLSLLQSIDRLHIYYMVFIYLFIYSSPSVSSMIPSPLKPASPQYHASSSVHGPCSHPCQFALPSISQSFSQISHWSSSSPICPSNF